MTFKYQVGTAYETLNGDLVTVVSRSINLRGYETLVCSDDKHRYDRSTHSSDAGRVTGTPHDNSGIHNFKRFFE